MLEQIRLPFWYDGHQYEIVEAGLRPLRPQPAGQRHRGDLLRHPVRHPADGLRPGPDEGVPARLGPARPVREAASPARRCGRPSSTPRRSPSRGCPACPACTSRRRTSPEFKDVMAANQAIAERTAYTVDEALGPINAVAKLRDRETSRRWQAHYDLIRGRLLAMKVRCYEYNWACARLKKDPPSSTTPGPTPGGSSPTRRSSTVRRPPPPPARPRRCSVASSTNTRTPPGPCSPGASSRTPWASSGWRPTCLPPRGTTTTPRPSRKNQKPAQAKPPEPPEALASGTVEHRGHSGREGDHATWNFAFRLTSSDDVVRASRGLGGPRRRPPAATAETRIEAAGDPRRIGVVTGRRLTSVFPGYQPLGRPIGGRAAAPRRRTGRLAARGRRSTAADGRDVADEPSTASAGRRLDGLGSGEPDVGGRPRLGHGAPSATTSRPRAAEACAEAAQAQAQDQAAQRVRLRHLLPGLERLAGGARR